MIFHGARNKVRDPGKLRLLVVELIGRVNWSSLSADVKGDAYEGLLEKNARDTKGGAGQYFTPRALVKAIVDCVDPRPGETVIDPACGTGGFLLAAHEHMQATFRSASQPSSYDPSATIRGVELVEEVARLAAMNLILHGIGDDPNSDLPVLCMDSLKQQSNANVDVVLTNPPFGVRGSVTYSSNGENLSSNAELTVPRPDFWVDTSNKQLNFIQHVWTMLKPGGRAAIVVPDNVLFESGAAAIIRRRLMEGCNVHTLLRLPAGLFYAQGVKANVLFFDKANPVDGETLWIYDFRTDSKFSLKARPLRETDLQEFVTCFTPGAVKDRQEIPGVWRWRNVDRNSILAEPQCSLDINWHVEDEVAVGGVDRLDEISQLIANDLKRALRHVSRAASPANGQVPPQQ